MKDHRPVSGPTHAGVGDTDHIADAARGEGSWDGKSTGLRHTCRHRPSIAQHEDAIFGHFEVGAVDAGPEVFLGLKNQRRSAMAK
jgi:hypothetical protein